MKDAHLAVLPFCVVLRVLQNRHHDEEVSSSAGPRGNELYSLPAFTGVWRRPCSDLFGWPKIPQFLSLLFRPSVGKDGYLMRRDSWSSCIQNSI